MTMPPEHREQVSLLNSAISSHQQWREVLPQRAPEWYGSLLTSIVVALDGREPTYVTVSATVSGQIISAAVVLYTDKLVLHATANASTDEDKGEVSVTARRRADLSSFSITAAGNAFSGDTFAQWPGALRAHVTYTDGFSTELPLSRSEGNEMSDLSNLVSTLSDDLAN